MGNTTSNTTSPAVTFVSAYGKNIVPIVEEVLDNVSLDQLQTATKDVQTCLRYPCSKLQRHNLNMFANAAKNRELNLLRNAMYRVLTQRSHGFGLMHPMHADVIKKLTESSITIMKTSFIYKDKDNDKHENSVEDSGTKYKREPVRNTNTSFLDSVQHGVQGGIQIIGNTVEKQLDNWQTKIQHGVSDTINDVLTHELVEKLFCRIVTSVLNQFTLILQINPDITFSKKIHLNELLVLPAFRRILISKRFKKSVEEIIRSFLRLFTQFSPFQSDDIRETIVVVISLGIVMALQTHCSELMKGS